MDAGPPELSREEEWLKLQGHPDVLATAPDDEVLAELLALQVKFSLVAVMIDSCQTYLTCRREHEIVMTVAIVSVAWVM